MSDRVVLYSEADVFTIINTYEADGDVEAHIRDLAEMGMIHPFDITEPMARLEADPEYMKGFAHFLKTGVMSPERARQIEDGAVHDALRDVRGGRQ